MFDDNTFDGNLKIEKIINVSGNRLLFKNSMKSETVKSYSGAIINKIEQTYSWY